MATERKDNAPPPRKPEADAPTTDQRIDLEAVFEGDDSSLAQDGDVDAPPKPGKPRH